MSAVELQRQLLGAGSDLIAMSYWRRTSSFQRHAYTANVALHRWICADPVISSPAFAIS